MTYLFILLAIIILETIYVFLLIKRKRKDIVIIQSQKDSVENLQKEIQKLKSSLNLIVSDSKELEVVKKSIEEKEAQIIKMNRLIKQAEKKLTEETEGFKRKNLKLWDQSTAIHKDRDEIIRLNNELKSKNKKITSQKEMIDKQNKQMVTLLKETHHRVKNNLQTVNSLLRLQSYEVEDEVARNILSECQNRIISMALIHEKMYQTEDLIHINVNEYFTSLCKDLIESNSREIPIVQDVQVNVTDIGAKTLVPLGLLINEMVSNSIKHAFVNKEKGLIWVYLNQLENNKYQLIVGDDGIGMKEVKESQKKSSLGTELLDIFTTQLEGELIRKDEEGTVYELVFEKIDNF